MITRLNFKLTYRVHVKLSENQNRTIQNNFSFNNLCEVYFCSKESFSLS